MDEIEITSLDAYNSWPVITKAPNGDLLVFYGKGIRHLYDNNRKVVYKRSKDKGTIWDNEITLASFPNSYDCSIFSVTTTKNGTIIAIVRKTNDEILQRQSALAYRSTNNGITWESQEIQGLPIDHSYLCSTIEIPGRGILSSFENTTPEATEYIAYFIWSFDDGLTWGNIQEISKSTNKFDNPYEIALGYLGFGKILGIARVEDTIIGNSSLFQIQSNECPIRHQAHR